MKRQLILGRIVNNLRTLVLGTIPPPLGGVSVYCLRSLYLREASGEDVCLYDSSNKLSLLLLLLDTLKLKLSGIKFEIEVNVSNPIVILLLYMFVASDCVFFDHNGSRRILSNKLGRFFFPRFVKAAKKILLVNKELECVYQDMGVFDATKFSVRSPYLSPTPKEISDGVSRVKADFPTLFTKEERNIVLCTAWQPVSSAKEYDLYGLLDTLEIFKKLIPQYPETTFILMIGELTESKFSNEIDSYARSLNHYDNFFYLVGGYSQLAVLNRTQILLRLTKTDGDSVSVREAIEFGAKVITTDVVSRPEGVILVGANDCDAVVRTTKKILNKCQVK